MYTSHIQIKIKILHTIRLWKLHTGGHSHVICMGNNTDRSAPWLYKSYCLSDMQICYQMGDRTCHSTSQSTYESPLSAYQLADLYHLTSFISPPTFFNCLAKWSRKVSLSPRGLRKLSTYLRTRGDYEHVYHHRTFQPTLLSKLLTTPSRLTLLCQVSCYWWF